MRKNKENKATVQQSLMTQKTQDESAILQNLTLY